VSGDRAGVDVTEVLPGPGLVLRPPTDEDVPALAAIRATPEVYAYWRGGDDLRAAVSADRAEPGATAYVVEQDGLVIGWIQWSEEQEPDYRHASIDLYLDPAVHGRGFGSGALRTLVRHLIDDHGHRRFEIDPATTNLAAIRCYEKVGFKAVGVRRQSERGPDGVWHDGLLMDLLADEFLADPG
jgi:aminoglycoside 6'-N-acetyltransferase